MESLYNSFLVQHIRSPDYSYVDTVLTRSTRVCNEPPQQQPGRGQAAGNGDNGALPANSFGTYGTPSLNFAYERPKMAIFY